MSNQYVLMENINNNNSSGDTKENIFEPIISSNNNSSNTTNTNNNIDDPNNGANNDGGGISHFLLEEDFSKESASKFPSKYKKIFYILASFIIIATIVLLIVFLLPRGWKPTPATSRKINVIMMIGDGMGPAAITLARRAFDMNNLHLDPYIVGTVQTFSSSSLVTDSAAAATAYGCGQKTYNRAIGVNSDRKSIGNIIEAAKQKKIKTGIVVTTRISDATPAGFYAHSVERNYENFIISQLLEKDIDVVLGGGKIFFTDTIISQAQADHNYSYVETRDQMLQVKKGKILGLFSEEDIPYEIDRINQQMKDIPTLAEMTNKALEILGQDNENGFFLMVEGSKIDVAGHQNDAASQIYETKAFDDAFQVALAYAQNKGDTLILVTADHETGGLTLGYQDNIATYPEYAWDPKPLFNVNRSTDELALLINADTSNNNTGLIIQTYAGVNLTAAEIAQLNSFKNNSLLRNTIGKFVSKRCNIGWTTFGHTGVDVNLYSFNNLNKTDIKFTGNHNNIEISKFISETLSLDMDKATTLIDQFNPTPIETSINK